MARKQPTEKKKRGRPKMGNPTRVYMALRVTQTTADAAKRYQDKHKLRGPSSAVRVAAEREFRRDGVLDVEKKVTPKRGTPLPEREIVQDDDWPPRED